MFLLNIIQENKNKVSKNSAAADGSNSTQSNGEQ
jgi:hypothetical protein